MEQTSTVLIVSLVFFGCSAGPSEPAPRLDQAHFELLEMGIKRSSEVQQVAIVQKGDRREIINIAIMVPYGTRESRAKELAENAVRMTKTITPDVRPSMRIGKGIYDYYVAVITPSKKQLAYGLKASYNPHITW